MLQTASAFMLRTDVVDIDTLARALLRGEIPADYADAIAVHLDDEFQWLWQQLSKSRAKRESEAPAFLTVVAG